MKVEQNYDLYISFCNTNNIDPSKVLMKPNKFY